MSLHQDPEVYVKQFVEEAIRGIRESQFYEEMKIPHLRIKADYGVENIVVEAEAPCKRDRGRQQLIDYMKKFGRDLGILTDIPLERYYSEYPSPCRDRVGFELYVEFGGKYDVVYKKEFEHSEVGRAIEEFRQLIGLLGRIPLMTEIGKLKPVPEDLIKEVNNLITSHREKLLRQLSEGSERVRVYFNEWRNTMSIIYGEDVISNVGSLEELFVKLTVYVAWLKALGVALLESVLGGGKYTLPIRLYIDGHKAAVELFWERRALARFNIIYFFERDEYDWVFDPAIADKLDGFFRDLGKSLLTFDWSQRVELDLLKRVYQNVVPREVRRQLGEFYTPDWIAQLMLWRALHILVKGSPPNDYVVEDPIREVVELIDEFYGRHNRMPRFIDPTCGSFTFGVQYLNALLKWYAEKKVPLNPIEFAEQVMRSVMGIDLNPVAVITARVNYLLQIHRLLTLYGQYLATQPVIPIFRVDLLSLHVSGSWKEKTLYAFVRSGGDFIYLKIPLEMLGISNEELANLLKRLEEHGLQIVEKSVSEGDSKRKLHVLQLEIPSTIYVRAKDALSLARSFIALLEMGVDGVVNELGSPLSQEEIERLERLRKTIQVLEKSGFNSLWHSMLFNYLLVQYAMREKFDLVLGNLPWVNVSKYPESYTTILKSIAKELKVSPPSQAQRKIDISIPLFAISLKYLAGSPSVTALMVPCSILRGLHGSAWREHISKSPHMVVEVWDLEEIQPFEGTNNQPGIVFVLKEA
jgi:DNA-binding MarR family transcriptional regulator